MHRKAESEKDLDKSERIIVLLEKPEDAYNYELSSAVVRALNDDSNYESYLARIETF